MLQYWKNSYYCGKFHREILLYAFETKLKLMSNPQKYKAMKTNFTPHLAAVVMLAVMLFAMGCKKTEIPTVALVESSIVVNYNKARLVAEVVNDGGGEIVERGFCYGMVNGPMDTILCDPNSGSFSVELSGLSTSTDYVCQAFAKNEAGRGYSPEFRFTTENDTVPKVKTWYIREITQHSAVASGQVLGSGGQTVEECGVCYSTAPHPTIDGMHVVAGLGLSSFDCQLTDLSLETKYYVRAYAVCTKGVYYGEQLDFCTDVLPLAVRTGEVSEVTASRAKAEGEVIRDGGTEVTEYGFCWDTEHEPTIEGLHIKAGFGMGEFSCYFSGLERGRTHYVRAYAIDEKGVAYGEEVEFLPNDLATHWPDGTLPGLFSVGPDHRVRFSQGNLQYYPDDNIWRFAEYQWDFVGGKVEDYQFGTMDIGTVYANGAKCDNTKTWKYYNGWMDLFGWGTSGWNNGNEYYKPYCYAAYEYDCASYGPVGNFDLTGNYAEADWGIHNTISNGGFRQWYTPTVDEIVYLITERETFSGMRFASAMVAGISGMILFPDDWSPFTYPINAANEHCDFRTNVITGNDWLEVLEPAGAVFLPAAGVRYQFPGQDGIWYDNPSYALHCRGNYWTTTQSGVCIAHTLMVANYEAIGPYYMAGCIDIEEFRCNGCSVRLISDE